MALNVAMNKTLIFFLLLLTISSPCHARILQQVYEVQVLVLNHKTGRPVPGWKVDMQLPDAKGEIHRFDRGIVEEAGKNGIAIFHIKSPIPQQVLIEPYSSCAKWKLLDTSEILRQGMVEDHDDFNCKKSTSRTATAQPGQIVVYAHLPTFWEKFQNFLDNLFPATC